ncbi:MAG: DUF2975 domain-containing protein [Caulobacteraceae bacterium]|nr:DUF2975 domain-containing protein [Caulobacteraceae bacterium]
MRALGPGSVSSFLKIILDVVFVALAIGVGVAVLLAIAAAVVIAYPGLLEARAAADLKAQGLAGPGLVVGLCAAALYLTGVLVIVGRLRRIFATLTAGDPFHPSNVSRLRTIGLMLAVLELGRYPVAALTAWLAPSSPLAHMPFNPTAWFAVLVVFVLAEVFREGARLRREAELTI